jgi:hypothetical protein
VKKSKYRPGEEPKGRSDIEETDRKIFTADMQREYAKDTPLVNDMLSGEKSLNNTDEY